jgi:hypothetical protein
MLRVWKGLAGKHFGNPRGAYDFIYPAGHIFSAALSQPRKNRGSAKDLTAGKY